MLLDHVPCSHFWHLTKTYSSLNTHILKFHLVLPSRNSNLSKGFPLEVTEEVMHEAGSQLCCISRRISSSAASRSRRSCFSRLIFSSLIVSSRSGGATGKASSRKEPSRMEVSSSEVTKTETPGWVVSLYQGNTSCSESLPWDTPTEPVGTPDCGEAGGGETLLLSALELELVISKLGLVVDLIEVLLLLPLSDKGEHFIFLFLIKSSSRSTIICIVRNRQNSLLLNSASATL